MSRHLITLLSLCLLGCASPNHEANTATKNEPVRVTGESHLISEVDVQEIIEAVRTIPRIHHNVLAIEVLSDNEVEVRTGVIRGPLDGEGDRVIIRREKDGWKWHDDGVRRRWVS